jgi:hypothetical protein
MVMGMCCVLYAETLGGIPGDTAPAPNIVTPSASTSPTTTSEGVTGPPTHSLNVFLQVWILLHAVPHAGAISIVSALNAEELQQFINALGNLGAAQSQQKQAAGPPSQ